MVAPTSPGSGGQGFAVAILRAGAGARARVKSFEISEFKFGGVAELSLFSASALTPSASESSRVLVVVVVSIGPTRIWGPRMPHGGPTSPEVGGQVSTVGILRAGAGARARAESLEMSEFEFDLHVFSHFLLCFYVSGNSYMLGQKSGRPICGVF